MAPTTSTLRWRTNWRRIQPTEKQPATISACGVGAHVAADQEVDADRQGGAEDQAGQVLADGRDPGLPLPARPGGAPFGAARRLRLHVPQGTAANSGFPPRRIGG